MANNIIVDSTGTPILVDGAFLRLSVDNSAPNDIDLDASVYLTYVSSTGETEIQVEINNIPDSAVADHISVRLVGLVNGQEFSIGGVAPITSGVFVVTTTDTIPEGSVLTNTKAYVMPHKNINGVYGRPARVDTPEVTLPEEPVPVTIVSPPSFVSSPKVGENVRVNPTQITGDGFVEIYAFRMADDSIGTNIVDLTFTGASQGFIVNGLVENKFLTYIEEITGEGISSPIYQSTTAEIIGAASTVSPLVIDTDFTVVSKYRGTDQNRFFTAEIHPMNNRMINAYNAGGTIEWSGQATPTPQTTEEHGLHPNGVVGNHGFECFEAIMSPTNDGGSTYLEYQTDWDWTANGYATLNGGGQLGSNTLPANSSIFGSDYSRVDKNGSYATNTRWRLRFQETLGGTFSDWSDQFNFVAPAFIPDPIEDNEWIYLNTGRHPGELAANQIQGDGRQFERCFVTSPNTPEVIYASQDVMLPIKSDDFGVSWYTPSCIGLIGSNRGHSIWCDPDDGERVVIAVSSYGRRTFGTMSSFGGLYLSTNGLDNCTLTRSLPNVLSTNQPQRWPHYTIAHIPAGTPSTRTIYFAYNMARSGVTNQYEGELWKSTNGGSSWAKVMDMPSSTFGERYYALAGVASGGLYIGTDSGLWYSSNPGSVAFTRASGTPSNRCASICTVPGDSRIWAAMNGNGLYRAASGGGSFTKVSSVDSTFDPRLLAVSPANPNRMTIHYSDRARYSHDGGSTWNNITPHSQLEGASPWSAQLTRENNMSIWHTTNQNKVVFQTNQHLQRSSDGGVNSYPSNNGFGFIDFYDMAFHHSDPNYIVAASQDVGQTATYDGFLSASHDQMTTGPGSEYNWFETNGLTGPFNSQGVVLHPVYKGCVFCYNGTTNSQVAGFYLTNNPNNISASLADYINRDSNMTRTKANCFGASDPNNPYYSYCGRYRIHWKLTSGGAGVYPPLGAGNESQIYDELYQLQYDFFSMHRDNGSVIYGGNGGSAQSSDSGYIYRSTNRGNSWALYYNGSAEHFRPIDMGQSVWASLWEDDVVFLCGRDGLRRVSGTPGSQTVTKIFDIRDYTGPTKGVNAPAWAPNVLGENGIATFAQDPFDPDIGYCNAVCGGGPTVFMTTNLTNSTPSWTDITTKDTVNGHGGVPKMYGRMRCHPLTGDLIMSGLHGAFIYRRPSAHDSIPGISTSLYDTTYNYLIGAVNG